ncbi:mitotic apparatus protein p62-like [Dendronephthya gigantea]|uniref:mitotic apparatus protein p62-like n=1 Tax=Dendronephthya gigantea TaxID=151771 RepID=UPI00106908FC|nr:mitotic apparatus protein p62-like [Dendronephthya gigantea]
MASLERNYFWGCTLSKDKPEVEWLGLDAKESPVEVDILNQLALSQACLGPKAKDNSHVVQVTTKGVNDNSITQPIIILGSGVRQVQCRLEFNSEATFKLIEGVGPVHLSGSHIQVLSEGYVDSDEEDSIDEGIASGKLLSPPNVKRQNPPKSGKEQRPAAKKARLEIVNGNDASSDEEPDQLIPINLKDDKAKVAKGKVDKTKKPAVDTKSKKPISAPAKKAKLDEDDEDDSEDDEDDDDDDFDVDSEDDDDDEDASDSDDDDDDSDDDDDDDDDDDEDDEDDEDDFDEESDKEEEGLTQNKGKPAKVTPGKKKEENKTPGKKQTPNKQTPKKGNMEASVNLPKTPDLSTVKQKLLKSPNLPKKMDKFKNFMKTNMKITDEKVVKDMWTFVQANKK